MIRRVIKKAGAVLLAAGLSIGMFSPSVSAAVKINKTAQMFLLLKRKRMTGLSG